MSDYYNINDLNTPHWDQVVRFTDGTIFKKTIPNDENDKESHEDHVLKLFMMWYGTKRYGIDVVNYDIIGRDGQKGQQHDYTVRLVGVDEEHLIEITKFGDSQQSHLAHALRDEASRIIDKNKKKYFVFLPPTTQLKGLKALFSEAEDHKSIYHDPDPESEELISFIEQLKTANVPYVRRVSKGISHIHTHALDRTTLRESLQNAITKKEQKDYIPLRQQDMILVLDDKSLNYTRQQIDERLELFNYYFYRSTFREIYLMSRMSNPSNKKTATHEFMIFPIKANWDKQTRLNLYYVMRKISEGTSMPLNF